MIYCIWYPSGGFGHYINAIVSLYGKNFCRPKSNLIFSDVGNSHQLDLIAPKYFKDPDVYRFDFDQSLNYSVLIDNGINNEGKRFKNFFPENTKVIKVGYSNWSWPIVAKTMIVKALQSSLHNEVNVSLEHWNTREPWALREKYFLYLRDHELRYKWKPDSEIFVDVLDIFQLEQLTTRLNEAGIELENFETLHLDFLNYNKQYVDPLHQAKNVLKNLNQNLELDITDIWTQAIVYYYIWLKYNIEVLHNDYSNWFTSTNDIVTMLANHGVDIDSN